MSDVENQGALLASRLESTPSDRRSAQAEASERVDDRRKNVSDRRSAFEHDPLTVPVDRAQADITPDAPAEKPLMPPDAITHLQQALQRSRFELKRSHDRYRELYESSPIGYITLTSAALITDINLSARRLLGVNREQLRRTSFTQLIKEQGRAPWQDWLAALLQGKEERNIAVDLMRADGTAFTGRLDCLHIIKGPEMLTLLLAIAELPAYRPVEPPCLATAAFEIEEGLMVTDAQKVILKVNRAFTRLTGFCVEDAIGQTPRLLSSGLQDQAFYQDMWQTIAGNGYWQGEIWNRHKNGGFSPEWLTISAISDAQGQVVYYVGSFLDITARKQAEKKMLDSNQALSEQLHQKQVELHQIKNELNDINTTLKVLLHQQAVDDLNVHDTMELEIQREIIPFLKQLKKNNHDTKQITLLRMLEANLQKMTSSYSPRGNLTQVCHELTPKELQVAAMIREGFSTKHIAETLSTSLETINVHRKNIRKKLGLDNKAINLRTHLGSFD